jgi:hypothetical protein
VFHFTEVCDGLDSIKVLKRSVLFGTQCGNRIPTKTSGFDHHVFDGFFASKNGIEINS